MNPLSMNLKTLALILKGLRVSGSWSQCMRKKTERGLSMNRRTHPRPLPGGELAFVRAVSAPLLGGVRGGFMVPMHAEKDERGLSTNPSAELQLRQNRCAWKSAPAPTRRSALQLRMKSLVIIG